LQATVTFPIVLPSVQWESPTSTPRVFLFNLKNDPFETNNIAEQNRELVERMAESLRMKLKGAPPQVGALHYAFRMFIFIFRVTEMILLIILSLTLLTGYRLIRKCTRHSSKLWNVFSLKTGSFYVPS